MNESPESPELPEKTPPDSWAGATLADLEHVVKECGQPSYRAAQVFSWIQTHGVVDADAMTNVPQSLRTALVARRPLRSSRIEHRHDSDDGTTKLLLALADGERVECVLIPEGVRRTACISTQVGCGVGCTFCASGAQGVIRNLSAAEIVEQVFWIKDIAGERPTHIVIMGMGEPLHNVDALIAALRLMQAPDGLDLGARRITVSTSGPVNGFESFLAAGLQVKLAISLHAVRDGLRSQLVPRGGTGTVEQLVDMARRWFQTTGRDVTYEYVLLDRLNDSDDDARALGRLCGPHRNVNVIPMNPVPFAPDLKAPPAARTRRFLEILRAQGAIVHARRQRGDDVAAACGQLRLSRTETGR